MFNVKTPNPHADAPAQGQCYPTPGLVSGANGATALAGPATVTLEQALAGLRAACDRTDILCQR
ncbi:hypothetical protein, partial [Aphanothece microscopica]|uniref:hypothetical protein n=1 Tax=Aphanothece microscopica TaxID=1049561 RepID=UPI00398540EC